MITKQQNNYVMMPMILDVAYNIKSLEQCTQFTKNDKTKEKSLDDVPVLHALRDSVV